MSCPGRAQALRRRNEVVRAGERPGRAGGHGGRGSPPLSSLVSTVHPPTWPGWWSLSGARGPSGRWRARWSISCPVRSRRWTRRTRSWVASAIPRATGCWPAASDCVRAQVLHTPGQHGEPWAAVQQPYRTEVSRWVRRHRKRRRHPAVSRAHVAAGQPRHTKVPVRDFEVGADGAAGIPTGVDEQPAYLVYRPPSHATVTASEGDAGGSRQLRLSATFSAPVSAARPKMS